MLFGLLKLILHRKRPQSPEELAEAVIRDIRHRLTEARLNLLAAGLAGAQLERKLPEVASAHRSLESLESALQELEEKRNLLVARARNADARLAIERSLLETGQEPARVALEMISDRVIGTESEADAIAEVLRITGKTGGTGSG